jgi:hypothetical protein
MGPPGVHAHLHYQPPHDESQKSHLATAMVVDYEAALVFLDVALSLTVQAVGVLVGRPRLTWSDALAEANKPPGERPVWLDDDAAFATRQLQATTRHARNRAVVHPKLHYVAVRTDNVGNVTYLRLPTTAPEQTDLEALDSLWHRSFAVREGVHAGVDASAIHVVEQLDQLAGRMSPEDATLMNGLRDRIGYALPSLRDIAADVRTLLQSLINYLDARSLDPQSGGSG